MCDTIQRISQEKMLTKEFPRFLDDFPGLIVRQVPVVIAFILEWSVQHSNFIRGDLDESLGSALSTSIRIRLKKMIIFRNRKLEYYKRDDYELENG